VGAHDSAAMARLTLSYIRLAVDHRASAQSLAMTDPDALRGTILSLESATHARPSEGRPLLDRWLAIARRRAQRWAETHASLEKTGHQLATISELAHLLHQESLCSTNSQLSAEVETILADFELGESAARELAEMDMVDTSAFEEGRTVAPT